MKIKIPTKEIIDTKAVVKMVDEKRLVIFEYDKNLYSILRNVSFVNQKYQVAKRDNKIAFWIQ